MNLFGKELFDDTKWDISGTDEEFTIQAKNAGTTVENISYDLSGFSFVVTIDYSAMNGSIVLRDNNTTVTNLLSEYSASSGSVSRNISLSSHIDTLKIMVYSKNTVIKFKKAKLEKSLVPTPWSPYGCGNINEKIQNKNFAPFTNQDFTVQGVEFKVINGTLYLNGTSTGEILTNKAEFKNNFSFILKAGTYKFSRQNPNSTAITTSIKRYSDNENIISLVNAQNNSVDLTLAKDTKVYLGFYIYQKTFTDEEFAILIEPGSTLSNYIPHAEQNISFPLAEGQVLAEGDYLADDGIHHKRGKVVFNGSEDWQKNTSFEKVFYLNNVITNRKTDIVNALSNYFIYGGLITSSGNLEEGKFYLWRNEQYISRIVLCINLSTLANLKTWLAEQYANGTPVEVEYDLAEEYVEPFTEEQAEAWKLIKKAKTYKTVTHISSEDETPATMDMVYVRDLQTVIDSLTNAIISLGGNV